MGSLQGLVHLRRYVFRQSRAAGRHQDAQRLHGMDERLSCNAARSARGSDAARTSAERRAPPRPLTLPCAGDGIQEGRLVAVRSL
jgi:hypothetical protein